MPDRIVDLRSDTTTRPTEEMRLAMKSAEVGDAAYGEDPSVNRLEELAAEKTGKEAALYTPSGTMANGCGVLVHTRQGGVVILHENSHINVCNEQMFVLAGATPHTYDVELGVLTPQELEVAVSEAGVRGAHPDLLCIENTFNHVGGHAWNPQEVELIGKAAHGLDLKVHMDGARIFNAAVALGVDVREYAKPVDTLMFCVSKGLSAPVGSLLCGDGDLISRARQTAGSIGGSMRQAGVIAAAGIVALETMVERLAEDHARAVRLAQGLGEIDRLQVRQPPNATNFVMVDASGLGWTTEDLAERWGAQGVLLTKKPPTGARLVLHRHIDDDDVEFAVGAARKAAA